MKLIQIAGFLGSGKTTTIIAISREMSNRGKRIAVVVNEIGEVPVDAKIISDYGLKVMDIGGGCICCELMINLSYTLEELAKLYSPDIVLIEPSGVAIPSSINDALGLIELPIERGPIVVLFDGLRGEELLADEDLSNFVKRQMINANIIAINKIDLLEDEKIRYFERLLNNINPNAKILRISAKNGYGINELIEEIFRG